VFTTLVYRGTYKYRYIAPLLQADKTREVVVREEAVASTKAEECQQIKDSAEKDLAEALPALDAAVAVLRNLKVQLA